MIEGFLLCWFLWYMVRKGYREGQAEAVIEHQHDVYRETHGKSHEDDPFAWMDPIKARLENERAASQAEGKGDSKKARMHRRQHLEVIQGGVGGPAPFSLDEEDDGNPFEEDEE